METHVPPPVGVVDVLAAGIVAAIFVGLVSLLREPARQRFMAIFVAGAGAAYLNGGLGAWEFVFTSIATVCAYQGLASYRFIALAWVLHVFWDVAHHLYGHPIVFFVPTSSAQCAVTDTVIAVWFYVGAPGVWGGAAKERATA